MRRHLVAMVCGIVGLWLCGCSEQELYARIPENQANDMVAVLRGAGIAAEKQARDGNLFALTTPRDAFANAMEVLRANGLPKVHHETLCEVFKKDGLVSSPAEDHARLLCALSQEIADTLSRIDGVIVARVHLSVPEKDPLAEKAGPSSASVFIKHRAGLDLSGRVGSVKALAVNAIQGLAYENVTVVLMPAEPWPAHGQPDAASGRSLDTLLMWVALLGAAALAAGAGSWAWQRRVRGAGDRLTARTRAEGATP